MNEIKLLILDDDTTVINSYKETIKRINRDDTSITYKTYEAKTLDEAKEIIKYNKLDTAIIDLNLCSTGINPDNADGNQAIKELMKNFRMPIFVVSGEIGKLEEELNNNHLIKVYTRDAFEAQNGLEKIIPSLYLSKSLHYFSRDGFLENVINDFYWNHLSKTMKSWQEVEGTHPIEIEKILSRHTVSSLNEQLYVNGNIGSFDKYHPGEMYIIPPIKEHYHTGDIISEGEDRWIILSPACDIVNQVNLDNYILAKIICFSTLSNFEDKIKKDKPYDYFYDSLNKKGKSCYDDCKFNKKDRFHYLPEFNIMLDNIIDFQNIITVPVDSIKGFKRIASIASPFLKDIIARFSAYYARQGQPNFL